MPKLSERSLKALSECHPDLQKIAAEAIKVYDFVVTTGHRGEADQNKAYAEGKSKLKYPQSKHNKMPSLAMDIVPYPVDYNDKQKYFFLAGVIFGVANQLGIKIRWGGDFNMNMDFKDGNFVDIPHFELVEG